jgi:D-alanyl-D-alanine carboxypeptidase
MSIHPAAKRHLLRKLLVFVVLVVIVAALVWWRDDQSAKKPQIITSTPSKSVSTTPASFDKSQHSINDPASIWVVVDKGRILPSNYTPVNLVVPKVALSEGSASENMHLRSEAAGAVEKLVAAAANDSQKLILVSGYRSFVTQQAVYSGYVSSQGQAYADATSARAGHSEHQSGLAADLGAQSGQCQLEACFGDMTEGKWLATNAHKYGFIIRYQKDKANLTGYAYEPWHIRFVGVDLAAELNKTAQTMEQFFGLTNYADYPTQTYQLKSGV